LPQAPANPGLDPLPPHSIRAVTVRIGRSPEIGEGEGCRLPGSR
jgi:hypothetical protein